MIKHLVISGGAVAGYNLYGAIKYLKEKNVWNINDIESIYSTSVGSYIAVILSLNYDNAYIDDYLIMRPWNKLITITSDNLMNFFINKGILKENITMEIIKPLLIAKDLSVDITMLELYNFTNIDIHIYTTNINSSIPETVDISYKTHPNLIVHKALAMSSAIPILFSPVCDGSNCYIDGALFNNFPLNSCLESNNNPEEILAFRAIFSDNRLNINNNSNFTIYLYQLIESIRLYCATDDNQEKINNIIECKLDIILNDWENILSNQDIRKSMIDNGIIDGINFYNKFIKQNQESV